MAGRNIYGVEHKRRRKRIAALVAAALVDCWRCGRRILPGSFWDLGHADWDSTRWMGPEHRGCNRSAGARKKQAMYGSKGAMINLTKINKTTDRW
jgi:hypothetical protein